MKEAGSRESQRKFFDDGLDWAWEQQGRQLLYMSKPDIYRRLGDVRLGWGKTPVVQRGPSQLAREGRQNTSGIGVC